MRKVIYIPVILGLLALRCGTEPDMHDSYTAEYFCFDGYRGIGVASVPNSSGSYAITVFAQPNEDAIQLASLVAEISAYEKTFSVTGAAIVENALFEFAYEHFGLPVESIEGDWIKVRLGKDASGNYLSGWISNVPPVLVEKWDTYLPARAAFLATCDAPVLYKSPNGKAFSPTVKYTYDNITKTKRPDYRIEYLEVNGDWLKVQFVTPSNLCKGVSQKTIITEGWVPFLSNDKSPSVWFYPRGC